MKGIVSVIVCVFAFLCIALAVSSPVEARGFGRSRSTVVVGGNGGFTQARFGPLGNVRSFQSFGNGGVQAFGGCNGFSGRQTIILNH